MHATDCGDCATDTRGNIPQIRALQFLSLMQAVAAKQHHRAHNDPAMCAVSPLGLQLGILVALTLVVSLRQKQPVDPGMI